MSRIVQDIPIHFEAPDGQPSLGVYSDRLGLRAGMKRRAHHLSRSQYEIYSSSFSTKYDLPEAAVDEQQLLPEAAVDEPEAAVDEDDGRCLGIRCNIWALARPRREITHKLRAGGNHQIGWWALMWQDMVSTNEVHFDVHQVLRYLPKRKANFLHEYYSEHFPSLNLPPLPSDWSQIDVHAMLEPFDIQRLLRRLQV